MARHYSPDTLPRSALPYLQQSALSRYERDEELPRPQRVGSESNRGEHARSYRHRDRTFGRSSPASPSPPESEGSRRGPGRRSPRALLDHTATRGARPRPGSRPPSAPRIPPYQAGVQSEGTSAVGSSAPA